MRHEKYDQLLHKQTALIKRENGKGKTKVSGKSSCELVKFYF